jgi:glycine cleavage system H protein
MSAILAFVTAAVLMLLGLLRRKRPAEHTEAVLVRRYTHPGHAWARVTDDGDVLVGVDDFAQSLVGRVDAVRLPRLLSRVKQGGVVMRLCHGGRELTMVSPVTGFVTEKNEMVFTNPGLVNSAPYGDGWLFRVKPLHLPVQIRNLMSGRTAQQWQDSVRAQLGKFFSGTPALMYQDGGVIVNDLADRCSDREWKAITAEFFLADDK